VEISLHDVEMKLSQREIFQSFQTFILTYLL
jgi:hypothetical protein